MTPDELRLARLATGLPYADFAAAIGISKGMLSKYETGRNPIPRKVELAVQAVVHLAPRPLEKPTDAAVAPSPSASALTSATVAWVVEDASRLPDLIRGFASVLAVRPEEWPAHEKDFGMAHVLLQRFWGMTLAAPGRSLPEPWPAVLDHLHDLEACFRKALSGGSVQLHKVARTARHLREALGVSQ